MSKYAILLEGKGKETEFQTIECTENVMGLDQLREVIGCSDVAVCVSNMVPDLLLAYDKNFLSRPNPTPNPVASMLNGYCKNGQCLCGNVLVFVNNEDGECATYDEAGVNNLMWQFKMLKTAMCPLIDFELQQH